MPTLQPETRLYNTRQDNSIGL